MRHFRWSRYYLKLGAMALFDALIVYWCVLLAWDQRWLFVGLTAAGASLLNVLILSRRAYPLRYLAPGLVFLGFMVVYPMAYTIYISLTNYATGYILPKTEVIRLLSERDFQPSPPVRYPFTGYGAPGNLYALYLRGEGQAYVILPDGQKTPASNHDVVDEDGDGIPEAVDGYARLSLSELSPLVAKLQTLRIPDQGGWLKLATLREFALYFPLYTYDPATDTLTDNRTGKAYRPRNGKFTADDGETLDPGWTEFVGLTNYIRFVRDPLYHRAFVRVFVWTVLWSVLSVGFSFALGLALAVLLNDRGLKLRKLYRSLLIVPYALPAFISVLIWRAFYNVELGLFNQTLLAWFGIKIPWLTNAFWARFSIVFTNVWLTYPYMMLVSLGALQSIPAEVYEAAKVDGAGPWQRFTQITFPLLMVSIAPLLIGSFAFTFNNFTLVWLLTRGEPVVEIGSRAGATDILLSYAYKLAFEGARGNEWSMASALAVVIFVIVILVSGISFSRTRALEEVSRGL